MIFALAFPSMRCSRKIFELTLFATALVGCGGGGGSDNSSSGPAPQLNRAPTLESFAPEKVLEGSQVAVPVKSSDPDGDTLSQSIAGADASFFNINAEGKVEFSQLPDWEAREDANQDNVFELAISVSDGALETSAQLEVTLIDALEGSIVDGLIDGATVFVDDNQNWTLDAGEDSAESSALGNFFLPYPASSNRGVIVALGGTDRLTGNALPDLALSSAGGQLTGDHIGINLFSTLSSMLDDGQRSQFNMSLGEGLNLTTLVTQNIWVEAESGNEAAARASRLNLQLGLLLLSNSALLDEEHDRGAAISGIDQR